MTQHGDDYLWDREGQPDPEVTDLERKLRALGFDDRPLELSAVAGEDLVSRRNRGRAAFGRRVLGRGPLLLLAAAVLLALGLGWHFLLGGGTGADAERVVLRQGAAAQVFETGGAQRAIHMESVGELTLDPRSRLRLQHWRADGTLLDLEKGRMSAFVYADVKPRFFQVDTPAVRCVDLGCRYDLEVGDDGAAQVHVTMGYVAFAIAGLEVFIPRGAECRATPGEGPGTPRFVDCRPELRSLLTKLDSLPRTPGQQRAEVAEKVTGTCRETRDTLVLYHLLLEEDPAVRTLAEQRLVELVDWPESARASKAPSADRGEWLAYLRTMWW